MQSKTRNVLRVSLAASGALVALFVIAQAASTLTLPQDKGPDKVDVSKYPAEIQAGYKTFTKRCNQCHVLARAINTSMTKEDWERYVKRMMHKPNSGIDGKQGKEIFDFLAYDQANRKDKDPKSFHQALTDEELQKLSQGK